MGVFGDTLRQARAYKGVTIKEAEQATRINRHYLAALEDENFGALPPLIYQRGIVRNYASYLDLDVGKLLAMFEEAHGTEVDTELVAAMRPLDMPNHWAPNFAIIAFMVVMSAIVFAWVYSAFVAPAGSEATAPPVIPTVTPVTSAAELELPTQTPVPTATPRPATATPLPGEETATETPVSVLTATPITVSVAPTATPIPVATLPPTPVPVVEKPTPPATGASLRIIAEGGGINVSVVVDGIEQYANWLEPGQSTPWFTGLSFIVYTSNGSYTLFENADPSIPPFYMGYGLEETYYLGG